LAGTPPRRSSTASHPEGTPGALPDVAEHGVTLVMDDASAKVAGKLLARYGVPFLPERVALNLLERIAPFVSKAGSTMEQIAETYRQLVATAQSEGGFGQHAVVVTSDSRYLGEVPFASW
jgi:phage gp36-like protein